MVLQRLTVQILDENDIVLIQGSYQIGTVPNDGFTFGKIGVGNDGIGQFSSIDCLGWTDDINMDIIYEGGKLVSNQIMVFPGLAWYELCLHKTEPGSSFITVTVMDFATKLPISGYIDLQGSIIDISGINRDAHPSIYLVANFEGNSIITPILHYWAINLIPPVEADAGFDDYTDEDISYSFDGSASWSSVGIADYSWDMDSSDGIDWSKPDYKGPNLWNPTHTYFTPGIYVITLNVTDINGYWDIDTITLTVNDITPPFADPGSDDSVDEDTPYHFDASGSWDNSGSIISYIWDMDASNGIDLANPDCTGISPTHTFSEPGIYIVTLYVYDSSGNFKTSTITISVNDVTTPFAHSGSDGSINEDVTEHLILEQISQPAIFIHPWAAMLLF
jgi:hypothetical protein